MVRNFLVVLFVTLCCSLSGQDTALIDTTEKVRMIIMRCPTVPYLPKHSLTAELGGNGGLYSINYNRNLRQFSASRLYWSAGLYVLPNSVFVVATPLSVNWQKPLPARHHLILGTGQVLIVSRTKGGYIRGTARLGYRYNFSGGKSFIEFAYTPFYSYIYNFQWDNWFGFSFGWNLKTRKS